MATPPPVSPANALIDHPLDELHRLWNSSNKAIRETIDIPVFRQETLAYLDMLSNVGPCLDLYNPSLPIDCFCMANLDLTEEEAGDTVDYLINYFKLRFTEQRAIVSEWKRYANTLSTFHEEANTPTRQVFLLPGTSTHMICKSALAKLIGKSKSAWSSIGEGGKQIHGLSNRKSNTGISAEMEVKLNEYFFSLARLGQPRATKIVRVLSADNAIVATELVAGVPELIELPACNTKRALYRSFLLLQGWEVSFDNRSRMQANLSPPISWPTFCSFWKQHYPHVVIQPASEDLCDDCVVFANRHKYVSEIRKAAGIHHGDDQRLEEEEDLVLHAAKHVEMARKQRMLFVAKKEEAKLHSETNMAMVNRTYTFVADFAQNMYVPNFAAEQPGATYYFSPLNVYPFGVVDTSTSPTMLTAFVYSEGTYFEFCHSF
jgi:hypothetical protein